MNEQTELLFEWRQRIFGLLTEEFVKGEDEKADGEEFSRSLETQGVAEILLQEYTAVIADRREVMLLERSALAAHDTRERKVRNTLAARKAADIDDVPMEQLDLEPEHEVLKAELSTARKELLKNYEKRALRSIVADLMHVVHRDDDPEKVIAREYANLLRRLIVEQGMFANFMFRSLMCEHLRCIIAVFFTWQASCMTDSKQISRSFGKRSTIAYCKWRTCIVCKSPN